MSDRFEREYLRLDREEVAWKDLEEKLDAETIDIRATMEEKRKWFRETFDYCADDESVNIKWRERND